MTDRPTPDLVRVTTHPAIDDDHVVERYLTGMLSTDEEEAFETHSLACDRCLDELEADERFRSAFAGILGHLRPEPASATASATASSLASEAAPDVAATSPGDDAAVSVGDTAISVDDSAPTGVEPPQSTQNLASPAPRRAARDRPSQSWALAAVAVLAVAAALLLQRQNARLLERLGQLEAPRAAPPWVRLQPLRSTAPESAARLHLEESTPWALITLEAEPPLASGYACRLSREGAASTLWEGSLAPDLWAGLTVLVPADDLVPGLYALRCRPEISASGSEISDAETVVRFEVVE
ncbi:MAG: hypothetical protein AAGC60_26990 [Acidobacteriota bacterium]